jgi:hypothetical protein
MDKRLEDIKTSWWTLGSNIAIDIEDFNYLVKRAKLEDELQQENEELKKNLEEKERIQYISDDYYRQRVKPLKPYFPLDNTPGIGQIVELTLKQQEEIEKLREQSKKWRDKTNKWMGYTKKWRDRAFEDQRAKNKLRTELAIERGEMWVIDNREERDKK